MYQVKYLDKDSPIKTWQPATLEQARRYFVNKQWDSKEVNRLVNELKTTGRFIDNEWEYPRVAFRKV